MTIISNLLESRGIRLICIFLAIFFVGIYLFEYYTRLPIIHGETLITFPNLINSQGESFWQGLMKKTCDLSIVEEGKYRPRLLGFMIGYVDTFLLVKIVNWFPQFGPRHPFVLVALAVMIVSAFLFMRAIFPTIPWQAALLTGACMLFFHNYQSSTYIYLRSAKLLTPAICLLVIAVFLRTYKKNLKNISQVRKYGLLSIGFFILCTLDEQVLAFVAAFSCLSLLFFFYDKKMSAALIVYGCSLILYALFYFWWGEILFRYYTPANFGVHNHQFADVLKVFTSFHYIEYAARIYSHALASFFANRYIWVASVCILTTSLIGLGSAREKILSILMPPIGIVIIACLIASHFPIYMFRDLWDSIYVAPACFLYFASWSIALSQSKFWRTAAPFMVTTFMVSASLLNMQNISKYYGTHLAAHGGHLIPIDNKKYEFNLPGVNPKLFTEAITTGSEDTSVITIDGQAVDPSSNYDYSKTNLGTFGGYVDAMESSITKINDTIIASGWGADIQNATPSRNILLISDDKQLPIVIRMKILREDVSGYYRIMSLRESGWQLQIKAKLLGIGKHKAQIFALQGNGTFVPLLYKNSKFIDIEVKEDLVP